MKLVDIVPNLIVSDIDPDGYVIIFAQRVQAATV
jgi:hypothetical protein